MMGFSLEAEALPLFAGGVLLVVLIEVVFTALMLRKAPHTKGTMAAHVVCMVIAFLFLGYLIFGGRPAPDGGAYNGTGILGFFGIFWCIGEICMLRVVWLALKK